jgi:hypothetical protein
MIKNLTSLSKRYNINTLSKCNRILSTSYERFSTNANSKTSDMDDILDRNALYPNLLAPLDLGSIYLSIYLK